MLKWFRRPRRLVPCTVQVTFVRDGVVVHKTVHGVEQVRHIKGFYALFDAHDFPAFVVAEGVLVTAERLDNKESTHGS